MRFEKKNREETKGTLDYNDADSRFSSTHHSTSTGQIAPGKTSIGRKKTDKILDITKSLKEFWTIGRKFANKLVKIHRKLNVKGKKH